MTVTTIHQRLRDEHGVAVSIASFNADATRVLTVSDDRSLRIWDTHFATMSTSDLLDVFKNMMPRERNTYPIDSQYVVPGRHVRQFPA